MPKKVLTEETQLATTSPDGDSKKKHTAHDDLIILRRERVQSLRARGLSQREIHATISTKFINTPNGLMPNPSYIENPQTREGFDLATINRDLKAVRAKNIKATQESVEKHKADQLAEIAELKRALWAEKKYKELIGALTLEASIRGTSINKTELSGPGGKPIGFYDAKELTDDQLAAIIEAGSGEGTSGKTRRKK